MSASIRHDPEVCQFALSPRDGNAQLLTYCLTYVSFDELGRGPSGSAEAYVERLRCLPLLKYVAKAWPYHMRFAEQRPGLDEVVLSFFNNRSKFMSWVQVINADSNFKWNVYPQHATSLYYAASFGIEKAVRCLLLPSDHPETLNAPGSRFGGTALHAAVIRGHVDIIKTLLDHGADPNRGDFRRVTPLHSASAQGDVKVVELLICHEVAVNARDAMEGKTPIEWAQMTGHDDPRQHRSYQN